MPELGSSAAVLDLWEAAAGLPPERRGSALVAAAAAEPLAAVEARPVGERDRRLLDLRRRLIGEQVEARGTCPGCGAEVEAAFALADLLAAAPTDTAPDTAAVSHAGLRLTVRAPSAGDLAALARSHRDRDAASIRDALLRLSVVRCETGAGEAAPIPPDAAPTVARAVEALDPLAAIDFALVCPNCGAAFEAPFDPPGFVWHELAIAAARLMAEVDRLARAYGWAEADILALSPARRQAYLEIAAG
jgi:uncharacterized protein (UPF0212 family)